MFLKWAFFISLNRIGGDVFEIPLPSKLKIFQNFTLKAFLFKYFITKFFFFFKNVEVDSCNYPPSEKRPRWDDITSMQAARPSIIRYASSNTSSMDQPGASQASVSSTQSSMQPGRKFKREWIDSHNASISSNQDREDTPLHALPGTSDVQVQSEFVNVYIFFLSVFSKIRQIFSSA